MFIHPLADVQSHHIGTDTRVWQFVIVLEGAVIGEHCNICSHCFIEADVVICDRVTIKNGTHIWDGSRIGNDVFIGPNVTFTNDIYPRSRIHPDRFEQTIIEDGASIGGGTTILPGLRIGRKAMIGAGSVVTKPVPDYALVYGVPARIHGDARHLLPQNPD